MSTITYHTPTVDEVARLIALFTRSYRVGAYARTAKPEDISALECSVLASPITIR